MKRTLLIVLAVVTAPAAMGHTPPPPCDNLLVYFNSQSAQLSGDARMVTDEAFRIASQPGRAPVFVAGHADPREKDRIQLARRRAEAVRARLIADGLRPDLVRLDTAIALPYPQPHTAEEHARNRQVVLSPACP